MVGLRDSGEEAVSITIRDYPIALDLSHLDWPDSSWPGWVRYEDMAHCKRTSDLREPLPKSIGVAICQLAQLPVEQWFSGYGKLIPDLSLHGAGLHEIHAGPAIGRHLDADTHARLHVKRVLSMMLYVHREWSRDWGGELVLESGISIEPKPGRLVIFDSREEWHRVEPVQTPSGYSRRSLALFWYAAVAGRGERMRAKFAK